MIIYRKQNQEININILELLSNISKNLLVVFICSYVVFLVPYFMSNNMPLQFDKNVISAFFILLAMLIAVSIISLLIFYIIDRFFKIALNNTTEDSLISIEYMSAVLLIIALIIAFPTFLELKYSIELNLFYLACWFLFCGGILFLLFKYMGSKILIILRVVNILVFIYLLYFIFKDSLVFIIMFNLIIIPITLIKLTVGENLFSFRKLSKWKRDLTSIKLFYFMKFNDKKRIFSKQFIYLIENMNRDKIIIIFMILFFMFNFIHHNSRYSINLSKVVLTLSNFAFKNAKFILKKEFADSLLVEKELANEKYMLVKSDILWSNDNEVFIKDTKQNTIAISKSNIPIIYYKKKKRRNENRSSPSN